MADPVRHLIQNKLIDYAQESVAFRKVKYDQDNKVDLDTNDPPLPGSSVISSCHVNETSSQFSLDQRNGRALRQKRESWIFQLRITFKTEVMVEELEEKWIKSPPVLARSDTSSNQVTLMLLGTDIQHPPQKTSSTGTKAVFTIQAQLSRT